MSPLDSFLSTPPIIRTLSAVIFTFSVLVHLGVLPFSQLNLNLRSLVQFPPEIWRLFTSLLITGRGFGILFNTYFIYVYGVKLEIASPRFTQRADFVTYLGFVLGVILLLNALLTVGTIFATALALAIVTSSTIDSWDQPVTFFVIKMPSQYLPYALIFFTLIICGPQSALVEATGLAAAHIYELLTGCYPTSGITRNLLPTPKWLQRMFGTQADVQRPYGTAFVPGSGPNRLGGGQVAWGLDLSWRRFGEGRRLGGEGDGDAELMGNQGPGGWTSTAMLAGAFVVFCAVLGLWFFFFGLPSEWASLFGGAKSSSPLPVGRQESF